MNNSAMDSVNSFAELEEKRAEAISALQDFQRLLSKLGTLSEQRLVDTYSLAEEVKYASIRCSVSDEFVEKARKKVDETLWRKALADSRVEEICTSEVLTKLRNDFSTENKNLPDFSRDAAQVVFNNLVSDSPEILRSSIASAYEYWRNKGYFRGGRRQLKDRVQKGINGIPASLRCYFFSPDSYSGPGSEELGHLNDLEISFALIAGVSVRPRYPERIGDRLSQAIRAERCYRTGHIPVKVTCQWFSVQTFKNGNILIEFHDKALLDKFNRFGANKAILKNPAA